MSLTGRLVAGMVAVLLVTVLVLAWSADALLRSRLEGEIRTALERDARLVRLALPADPSRLQASAQRLGQETGLRITIIDTTGRVVAESELGGDALANLENHLGRPEIQEAIRTGTGANRRISHTVGRPLLYVAIRGGPGFVRVSTGLETVDAVVSRAQGAVLLASLLALALGLGIAMLAARSFARPLTEAAAAARAIADGQPPHFPRAGVRDVDALIAALREMHEQLSRRFEDLRREREESTALVEAMVEGVLAADARGRILTANSAARRLLGFEAGREFPNLTQLFHPKPARDAVDAALRGEVVAERELELEDRVLLASARPLATGGTVLVLHDVTALRRLESVRRDFVANVSHELKTPLTSIAGYAETLAGETPDPDTSRRFLEVILANSRRMQRLVDDLLDLSRIESGGWQPEPEPQEVAAVAREVLDLFADRAAEGGVECVVEVAPEASSLEMDPQALRQVLSNLVDNALRYTPSGGRITIAARRDGTAILLEVRDTGAGIPSEHLTRLFERFYRVDPSRSRAAGGTGLGLAIVKHLIEAHGGECEALSTLGVGTTIRCRIPQPREAPPPA
jgi:two-component system phosphate regulon sensor histidine kinase PhoR